MPPKLKVKGSIVQKKPKLQWKPVARAKAYAIEWLSKDRTWDTLWTLRDDEIAPNEHGLIEYVDNCPGPMGPGGTYRVIAYFNLDFEGKTVVSSPVVLPPNKPKRLTLNEFSRRVKGKKWPANVKSLILRLKWSQHVWTMLLPKEVGLCLGKRIEVSVKSQELTDEVLDLLALIFANMPKLASRSEKAFNDYGGPLAFDEDIQIDRPWIVIDDSLHEGKSAGRWTMVIKIKGSDYGWDIEFMRSRFRRIAGGD